MILCNMTLVSVQGQCVLLSDTLTDGGFLVHHFLTQALKGVCVIIPARIQHSTKGYEDPRGHSYQIARRNVTLVGWLFLPSGKKVLGVAISYLQGFQPFIPSKPPPYPPLGPLATSISALRMGAAPQASSWWTWAPAAHSLPVPSSDSTQKVFSNVIYAQ